VIAEPLVNRLEIDTGPRGDLLIGRMEMVVQTDRSGASRVLAEDRRLQEPVTVAIINFNGKHHLGECLDSVTLARGPIAEVIVVDDCSTDGSAEFVRREFPWVLVIELPANQGPAAARNAALKVSRTRLVALLDNDVVVDKEWLIRLVEAMTSDNRAALCSSRAIVYERPEIVDRDGDEAHFVGMPTLRNAGARVDGLNGSGPQEIGAASGISILVDTLKLDGRMIFDTDYFYNFEDLDFCLMLRTRGYKCLIVPQSVVYHKYLSGGVPGLSHDLTDYSPRRAFYVFRNRLFIHTKFYALTTLILLTPALLIFELVTMVFAVKRKVFMQYLSAWRSFFNHLPALMMKRRAIQASRLCPDSALLSANRLTPGPATIQGSLCARLLSWLDLFLRVYWFLARRAIPQGASGQARVAASWGSHTAITLQGQDGF